MLPVLQIQVVLDGPTGEGGVEGQGVFGCHLVGSDGYHLALVLYRSDNYRQPVQLC